MKTYKAIDISNYLITLANSQIDEDFWISEWLTHLKLQKVLYFIQATYLVNFDEKAFEEQIMAWKYWPIVREIYEIFKGSWNSPLSIYWSYEEDIISEDDKKTINDIWEFFGKYSAYQLIDMTHSHLPWQKAKQSQEISIESIREFYTGKLVI